MLVLRHGIRASIVLGLVVLALSGAATAAESASLEADPMEASASSAHTLTVTVQDRSAGQWTGLSVNYVESGANPDQITAAAVSTIGIDRDDDARGRTIDVDASDDLDQASATSEGLLTFELGGAHSLEPGDEIVIRYVGVFNPARKGDYPIPIDVNPSIGGGTTDARLAIGSNRATVLVDNQATTGDTITVNAVTVPDGGFVVLHDEEALGSGAGNVDAITAQSVIGTSEYLSAGSHEDVKVQLSGEISADASYVAMAVKDSDGDETFAADADGPYTVNGNPIWERASFTVREPTATATDTEAPAEDTKTEPEETEPEPNTDEGTPTPAESPGFGATLGVLTLVGAILALGRRRE